VVIVIRDTDAGVKFVRCAISDRRTTVRTKFR